MMHEISQLDIPNRQELTANLEPRVSYSKEIGEATITHTIFGRAKVRITRKYDNLRRALWWALLVAVAAVAWQAWLVFHPAEPLPSADSMSPVDEQEQETRKVPQHVPAPPETIATPAAVPLAESKPVIPPATEVAKPAIIQKSAPQPAPSLRATGPIPAKPVVVPKPVLANQPITPVKPQSAPLAASSVSALNQPGKPLPAKPVPTSQPVAPAAVLPHAALPAAHPAASSPAMAAPLASPIREASPTQAPAGVQKPAESVSAPGK